MSNENKPPIDFSNMTNFAKFERIALRDINARTQNFKQFSKYTKDKVAQFLNAPDRYEKELRDASNYMYNVSSHYRRLINYFAKMPTYAYILTPAKLDSANVKDEAFRKAVDLVETMNMRHEFIKVMTTAFREDVFFGYEHSTSDSYFIQQLDPSYCKLSSIEDGCLCFAFDFDYFSGHEDRLEMYAPEFKQKYQVYKRDRNKRWQELEPKRTLCVKIQDDLPYAVPPFSGVLPAIYDITDYKDLMKAKTETGNYKMLALKIPFADGNMQLDLDLAKQFYHQMGSVLPENIGAVLTPMPIESFDFEKSGSTQDTDAVNRAESQFWSSAGTSSYLFAGGGDPSARTLSISINTDAEMVYAVLRQLERWVNRKLKSLSGTYKFKASFLNVNVYNQQEVYSDLLKGAQSSLPLKMAAAAALGFSASDVEGLTYLENSCLHLHEKFVPLSTSHTQSGEAGRPSNDSQGKALTDAGEASQEQDI